MNLNKYKGLGQFGPAYKIMFENDIHAPNSVDRVLTEQMILLCPKTQEYLYSKFTPTKVSYTNNPRPILEGYLKKIIGNSKTEYEKIKLITKFCKKLAKTEAKIFGGTEEKIIKRGSDWCTDLARVGSILFQIAGFPSRLVTLINIDKAYSGHEIAEVYWNNKWGAIDTTYGIIYRNKEKRPLSVWDLMNDPGLIRINVKRSLANEMIGKFRSAALVNYFAKDFKKYIYTKSKVNDYYRGILKMSSRGWPGGIRWLNNEDKLLKNPKSKPLNK